MRTATISINQQALKHNLAQAKQHANKSKVLAMVKANAYGHGIKACLPALADADGLGVATFAEAQSLRQLGWQKTIVLIEGVFSEQEWIQATKQNFSCIIHHQPQLQWALKHIPKTDDSQSTAYLAPDSRTIWLKINTGMNRLGFAPEEIPEIAQKLVNAGYHIILTSHFANADVKEHPLNGTQCQVFSQTLTQLRQHISADIQGSLCNSAGIIHFPEYHYDWVRAGIMLYGGSPVSSHTANELNLKAVMTTKCQLMAVHHLPKGVSIGYGSRFITDKPLLKGIISFGYGDGYPRVVDDNAWVAIEINDHYYRCPLLGRVAMDMMAVDLTAIVHDMAHKMAYDVTDNMPPQIEMSLLNSPVILWGEPNQNANIPHIDDIAHSANTISYELLCRLTQRPQRLIS